MTARSTVGVSSPVPGFWLNPSHRGKGVTSAALKLAVEFIGESSIPNLTARTIPENTASQRVLERAGFTLVGRNVSVVPSGKEVELLNNQRSTQV
ncbi:GNAT family N-acetyltransferase [Helcobacillus massiliensis]|uniref:GNAT family N-acetyltransferase n=1 Tax=Helcobacillus massiliensis TaxID=521392 RepID=UPI001612D3A6